MGRRDVYRTIGAFLAAIVGAVAALALFGRDGSAIHSVVFVLILAAAVAASSFKHNRNRRL